MTEISAREFGRLEEKVNGIVKTMDDQTQLLKIMDRKLDGNVTSKQLNERLKPLEEEVASHEVRLTSLEQAKLVSESSVWRKIGRTFESGFVKFVVGALLLGGFLLLNLYIQQANLPNIEVNKQASD